MANPWDSDPVVGANPWDADPVVSAPGKADFSNVQTTVRNGGRNSFRAAPAKPPGKGASQQEKNAYLDKVTGTNLSPMTGPGLNWWELVGPMAPAALGDPNVRAGAGKAFADVGNGLKQLFTQAQMADVGVRAGIMNRLSPGSGNDYVRRVGLPLEDSLNQQYADTASRNALDAPLMSSKEGIAGSALANAAMMLGPGAALRGTSAAGAFAPTTIAGNALQGGVLGYIQPAESGSDRMNNAAIGLGMGGGFAAAPGVIGKALSNNVTPELRSLYQRAQSMGIQLTPAQLTDSAFVKRLSGMLDKLPMSGAAGREARQQGAGNAAVANLIGMEGGKVSQGMLGHAADTMGTKFDQIFADGMQVDRKFLRQIASVRKEANQQMDDTAIRTVNGWVDRIRKQAADGQMSGRTLQSLDQSMRRAATGGGDRQLAAEAFRDALHKAFSRQSSPDKKAAWDELRQQWATLKTIEPLVARNPTDGIPMQQLQGAINSTQKGRTLRSRGKDGALGALATIGQRIKGPSTSGTAENAQSLGLGAALIANPAGALASVFGGRAINNVIGGDRLLGKSLANFMMREKPGSSASAIAPYFRRAPVVTVPTATNRKKQ